jgi:hypothetical protein
MTRNPEDRRSALNYWLYPRVTAAFTESAPVLHCADQSLVEAVHAVLGPAASVAPPATVSIATAAAMPETIPTLVMTIPQKYNAQFYHQPF